MAARPEVSPHPSFVVGSVRGTSHIAICDVARNGGSWGDHHVHVKGRQLGQKLPRFAMRVADMSEVRLSGVKQGVETIIQTLLPPVKTIKPVEILAVLRQRQT